MDYHTALVDYTNKLNSAIESIDIATIELICRDAVLLIRENEPLKSNDMDVVNQFTNSHMVAESLVKQVRDQLRLEMGRSKNARKGIKQYKGISSNG